MQRTGGIIQEDITVIFTPLYHNISCRHSYDGDADIDSYEKEGSDISSLYVSMYKRDYYIHDDNNNEHTPGPPTKIIPSERNRNRSILLKAAAAASQKINPELKDKVGPYFYQC